MKNLNSFLIFNILNSILLIACDSIKVNIVDIKAKNNGKTTDFTIASLINSPLNPSNAWIGIGFNSVMSPTNAVICKSKSSGPSVEQYHNHDKMSHPLVASNPKIGISNAKVEIQGDKIVCSFTRDNMNETPDYFNIKDDTLTYLISAVGPYTPNGEIAFHGPNYGVSSRKLNLSPSQ